MPMTHRTPRVRLERRTAPELDADLVIVPVSDGDDFADVPGLAQAAGGEALAARARGAFSAKPFETLVLPTQGAGWQAPRVALVGNGARKGGDKPVLERLKAAPSQPAIWQVHYATRSAEANTAERQIANLVEGPQDQTFSLQAEVTPAGAISVLNERNGARETYAKPR